MVRGVHSSHIALDHSHTDLPVKRRHRAFVFSGQNDLQPTLLGISSGRCVRVCGQIGVRINGVNRRVMIGPPAESE